MNTGGTEISSVLWRRLDGPGMEQCRLLATRDAITIAGAVVTQDGRGVPWQLEYGIQADAAWYTRAATVRAHAGTEARSLTLHADPSGRWTVNEEDRPDLQGCTDVDLGFSPSTNTLPIRRLELAVGGSATIEAAWVQFPTLAVKRVSQRYTRLAEYTYRYENLPTGFQADLNVDAAGLVVAYPPGWERTGSTRAFADVLLSSVPSPELGEASGLYAPLMGSWNVEAIDVETDGSQRRTTGEWHFSWALEGRAVQDVFIVPARNVRGGLEMPSTGNRYGTTIRFHDRTSGQWVITWFNPVTGAVNRLLARREGDAIVQVGTDPDGTMRRWTFRDMSPERFRWVGEESRDGGTTWRTHVEFLARRPGGEPEREG